MKIRCFGCMEMMEDIYNVCPHCGYIRESKAVESVQMEPGTIFHDRYVIGRVIGHGGFGITYIAWVGTLEIKVAITVYMPSEFSTRIPGQTAVSIFSGDKAEQFESGKQKFIDEAKKLAKFKSEDGIVRIYDSFEDNNTAYIVMEYLEGMTLTDYLKKVGTINEDEAVRMLLPVMNSLQVVHSMGILHRDIAPDNIFVTSSGETKLIDFAASRFATTSHSRSLTVIVKPGFSPEEQYRSRGDQGTYTDVYSLAATLYKMITGVNPPDSLERRAMYENRNKDILPPLHKYAKRISPAREIAILNAMNVRIEDRTPDIKTFIDELQADPPAQRRYGKIKKIDFYTWPLWVKAVITLMASAVIITGVLLITGVIKFSSNYKTNVDIPDGVVICPDVEGLEVSEAVKIIESSNLVAEASGSVISEYIDAGRIVLQDPFSGMYLDTNDVVRLSVSSGVGEIEGAVDGISTVPYVIWDKQADAVEKLTQAGLGNPEITTEYNDNVAEGLVISQSEAAGNQVPEGTVIKISVSLGAKPISMINVVGLTETEAIQKLSEISLGYETLYVADSSVKAGTVTAQSVNEGEQVVRGSKITISVATAETEQKVDDVVGMQQDEAVQLLKSHGYKVRVLENSYPDNNIGVVKQQKPVGGSVLAKDSVVTIYINKGQQSVNIIFNANGGNCKTSRIERKVGDTYGSLPMPERKGYTFDGWYTSAEGGNRISESSKINSNKNITVYAHWSSGKIKVTFDSRGGSAVTSKSYSPNDTYGSLPTPKRSGYTFNGWYSSASGGDKITSSTRVKGGSSITLYAHWTKKNNESKPTDVTESVEETKTYVVIFDTQGGSSVQSRTFTEGSVIGSLPETERNGYIFNGWYTAASGGNKVSGSDAVYSDMTVYAHWTKENSGTNETTSAPQATNTPTAKPATPTPTSKPKPTTAPTAKAATFTPTPVPKYTVSFDSNGGDSCSDITVVYGDSYGSLPAPTRSGYEFEGWYLESSLETLIKSGSKVSKASNHTLYAKWSRVSVTVSFDSNGGSSVSDITVKYGSEYGSLPSSSRNYYNFEGWYTSRSGGSKVSSGTTVDSTSPVTLYAHWSEKGWGGWTNWSNNKVTEKSSDGLLVVQVETRKIDATYKTQYKYSRWYDYWSSPQYRRYSAWFNKTRDCTTYEETNWLDAPLPNEGTDSGHVQYGRNYDTNGVNQGGRGTGNRWDIYWYNEQTRTVENTPAYTQYRYRERQK